MTFPPLARALHSGSFPLSPTRKGTKKKRQKYQITNTTPAIHAATSVAAGHRAQQNLQRNTHAR